MCVKPITRRENGAGKNQEHEEQKGPKQGQETVNVNQAKWFLDNLFGWVMCATFQMNMKIRAYLVSSKEDMPLLEEYRVSGLIFALQVAATAWISHKKISKCSLQKVICILKRDILLIIHEHYLTGASMSVEHKQWLSTPLATQKPSAGRTSLSL